MKLGNKAKRKCISKGLNQQKYISKAYSLKRFRGYTIKKELNNEKIIIYHKTFYNNYKKTHDKK